MMPSERLERLIARAGSIEPGDWLSPRGEWHCVSAVELDDGGRVVVHTLEEELLTYPRAAEVHIWRAPRRLVK